MKIDTWLKTPLYLYRLEITSWTCSASTIQLHQHCHYKRKRTLGYKHVVPLELIK